ncbi:hypothetical protein L915_11822, partial [Phytophthora nicotianae]
DGRPQDVINDCIGKAKRVGAGKLQTCDEWTASGE